MPACCTITAYMRTALISIVLAALGFLHLVHPALLLTAPASAANQGAAVAFAEANSSVPPNFEHLPPSATTTIVNNYITQPIVQHTIETKTTQSGVSEEELTAKLQALSDGVHSQLYGSGAAFGSSTLPASGGLFNEIALSNRINALSGVTITGDTIGDAAASTPPSTSNTASSTAATTEASSTAQ
jgi:hypothetical protein